MKSRMALLLSLGAGILAVIAVAMYLRGREAELLQLAALQDTVVATVDILQNTVVDEDDVTIVKVPRTYVMPGAIAAVNEAVGRIAAVPIPKGSQVTGTALLEGGLESLAFDVPRGMRATTIAVSDVTGVAGLVRAGNFIDLVGTFEYGVPAGSSGGQMTYSQEKTETFLVAQNIQVIAVGRDFAGGPPEEEPEGETLEQAQRRRRRAAERTEVQNLTLLLTPAQVLEIVLAQQIGSLTVALRSNHDAGQSVTLGRLDQLQLLRVPMPTGEPSPPPSVPLKSKPQPSWREFRGSR